MRAVETRIGLASAEMPLEEIDRPLPCERRRLLVEARRRVVVEAVIRARVEIRLVLDAGVVERSLIRRPAGVDALVGLGVVQQQGRADIRHLLDRARKTTRLNS